MNARKQIVVILATALFPFLSPAYGQTEQSPITHDGLGLCASFELKESHTLVVGSRWTAKWVSISPYKNPTPEQEKYAWELKYSFNFILSKLETEGSQNEVASWVFTRTHNTAFDMGFAPLSVECVSLQPGGVVLCYKLDSVLFVAYLTTGKPRNEVVDLTKGFALLGASPVEWLVDVKLSGNLADGSLRAVVRSGGVPRVIRSDGVASDSNATKTWKAVKDGEKITWVPDAKAD